MSDQATMKGAFCPALSSVVRIASSESVRFVVYCLRLLRSPIYAGSILVSWELFLLLLLDHIVVLLCGRQCL